MNDVPAAPASPPVDERNWRPNTLEEFIGQTALKAPLGTMLASAKARRAVLEHICFYGGPGLGKTTLAAILAREMGSSLRELAAPSLTRPADLVKVLAGLRRGDVLFLDEIHALKREIAEMLYSAMEDFRVGIHLGKQGDGEILNLDIERFTLVGATTDFGLLPEPLRARFGQIFQLSPYSEEELRQVVSRAAAISETLIDRASLEMIARRARGTPRLALRLFRRCYDLAVVRGEDLFEGLAEEAIAMLGIDEYGLDEADRRYLRTLVDVYEGGPVGLKPLALSAGLDRATAERNIEPWLLRSGLIARTRRGRRITRKGMRHIAPEVATLPGILSPSPDNEEDPDLEDV